jgi:hypothetical protein
LYEVPHQERNEQCQSYQDEEWQACYPGCVPEVLNQDVQNWQELNKETIK